MELFNFVVLTFEHMDSDEGSQEGLVRCVRVSHPPQELDSHRVVEGEFGERPVKHHILHALED